MEVSEVKQHSPHRRQMDLECEEQNQRCKEYEQPSSKIQKDGGVISGTRGAKSILVVKLLLVQKTQYSSSSRTETSKGFFSSKCSNHNVILHARPHSRTTLLLICVRLDEWIWVFRYIRGSRVMNDAGRKVGLECCNREGESARRVLGGAKLG